MKESSLIGKRILRPDAPAKAAGTARYTADYLSCLRGILYAKVLYPPMAHARILSVDTSEAERLPGVKAVITAKDVPGVNGYGIMVADKPVLANNVVCYSGDAVAAVAAVDSETAQKALSLIKVEYDPLFSCDSSVAMANEDALILHENHPTAKGNISQTATLIKGSVQDAFKTASVIIDETFDTPVLDHAYLERDISIAEPNPEDGSLTIYSPQHSVHTSKRIIAAALGIPQNKIRIVSFLVGGAFGGKEDSTLDVSIIPAILALKTGKIVALEFSREEVFQNTGKRHGTHTHYRLAADKEGKLLGINVQINIDKGAYVGVDAIPNRMVTYSGGPYNIPAAQTIAQSVFTTHSYGCAFRGLGAPQMCFAVESAMDDLARQLKMDPFELRLKNILRDGDRTVFNQVMQEKRGLGLEECLQKVRDAMHWNEALENNTPYVKKGRGIACYMYGTGPGGAMDGVTCYVQMEHDGSLDIGVSANELGQGMIIVMQQMAAESFGIPPEKVSIHYSDTSASPDGGATTASRTTVFIGNAIINACSVLKERILKTAAERMNESFENLLLENEIVFSFGKREEGVPLTEVIRWARLDHIPLSAVGSWFPPKLYPSPVHQSDRMPAYAFGVQGILLQVDIRTGEITILKSICACDVGRAINPLTVEGQLDGGVAQGISWALMEEALFKDGIMENTSFHKYLIPTAADLPEMTNIIVEHPNELGPFGAKGVGEPPVVPVAAAIRNAILDATGIALNQIPFTAVRMREAIEKYNSEKNK